MPNGTVAVALSIRQNTDIYSLDSSFKNIASPLVTDSSIDVSPSFDQSGNLMAFVSDRLGNPTCSSRTCRRAAFAARPNPATTPIPP